MSKINDHGIGRSKGLRDRQDRLNGNPPRVLYGAQAQVWAEHLVNDLK